MAMRVRGAWRPGVAAAAFVALAFGCTTERVADGTIVQLPPGSEAFERYINSPGQLTADRIVVQTLTAYRGDVAPVTTPEAHTRSVTPDRIELKNKNQGGFADPVRLSFRSLHLAARDSLEVRFSDVPLEHLDRDPIVLIIAEGVAKFDSVDTSLLAEKIVIRNGEALAFRADGQPMPAK